MVWVSTRLTQASHPFAYHHPQMTVQLALLPQRAGGCSQQFGGRNWSFVIEGERFNRVVLYVSANFY